MCYNAHSMANEQPDYSKLGIWRVPKQEIRRDDAGHELRTLAQQLGESLNIADRAKKDALRNIPSQDEESPTHTEQEIVNLGRSIAHTIFDKVRSLSGSIEKNANELSAHADTCRKTIGAATDTKPIDVDEMLVKKGSRCAKAQEDVHNKEVNYEQFKEENKLQREATVPNKASAIIWVGSIVVLEGIGNAYLFAAGSELGLLGGSLIAFLVSLCNVVLAFLGGFWCARYMVFHTDLPKKVAGTIGTLLFTAVCFHILVFAAAYIVGSDVEQAAASADRPPIDGYGIAINALREQEYGFVFGTFKSTLLMIAGFVAMLIGFIKGVHYKDPYPGFGDLLSALDDAKLELEEAKLEIIGKNRDICIKHKNQLKQCIDKISGLRSDIKDETAQLSNILGLLPDLNSDLTGLMQAKVKEYRNINSKNRKTSSPAYFGVAYPDSDDYASLDKTVAALQNAKYDFNDWNDKCSNAMAAAADADAAINGLDRRFSGK